LQLALLLFLEELQQEMDVRMYDLQGATFTAAGKGGMYLVLEVRGVVPACLPARPPAPGWRRTSLQEGPCSTARTSLGAAHDAALAPLVLPRCSVALPPITLARPPALLQVPGLAENRPSVLRGDALYATPAGEERAGREYQGFVHHVGLTSVSAAAPPLPPPLLLLLLLLLPP
jgi:hypothetical protein